MYLAFKGMYNCWKNSHDRIFFVTYFGYLLVGSGSFAFHATLKCKPSRSKQPTVSQTGMCRLTVQCLPDPMQLIDELSMIYTTCLMFWATFAHNRSPRTQIALGIGSFSLALFITLYYHYLQDPTFHQNAYALLTAIVLFRSIYIMETLLRPKFRQEHRKRESASKRGKVTRAEEEEQKRQDRRDGQILRKMWTMIAIGLSIFLGGFAIWSLDNVYCSTLRRWRHEIGLPWGVVLEGHGWWHLMTGTGAYFYIVWGIWLRHCLNGRQDEFELVWPSIWASVPRVERVQAPKVNGHVNGSAKKGHKSL